MLIGLISRLSELTNIGYHQPDIPQVPSLRRTLPFRPVMPEYRILVDAPYSHA